jgi:transcriptional regulator with XRE-family HTH domain
MEQPEKPQERRPKVLRIECVETDDGLSSSVACHFASLASLARAARHIAVSAEPLQSGTVRLLRHIFSVASRLARLCCKCAVEQGHLRLSVAREAGISAGYFSRVENSKRLPPASRTALRIAHVLNLDHVSAIVLAELALVERATSTIDAHLLRPDHTRRADLKPSRQTVRHGALASAEVHAVVRKARAPGAFQRMKWRLAASRPHNHQGREQP